jgi:hypothetical protein
LIASFEISSEPGSLEQAPAVHASRPEQQFTIRLGADLVERFKSQCSSYQVRHERRAPRLCRVRAQTDALTTPSALVASQACVGRICLTQAMPSVRTDPGPSQGRAQRAGFAGRRSLTGAGIGA